MEVRHGTLLAPQTRRRPASQHAGLFNFAMIAHTLSDIMNTELLLADKTSFDDFVYMPWRAALEELEARKNDTRLTEYLATLHKNTLPENIHDKPILAMFRNVATPNHEAYRFRIAADVMPELEPVLFEYTKDKFADINPSKRALGKLCFYKRLDKNGTPVFWYKSILDIQHANGKLLNELRTVDGTEFVNAHHTFFNSVFGDFFTIEDISEWLHHNGTRPQNYYLPFLSLFLQNGILLENFLFTEEEKRFNRDVILPALITLREQTGYKPLIVALEPTDIEGDRFWTAYPDSTAQFYTP